MLNTSDGTNKIDQGDECYFDIVIDPSSTEVSVSYSVSIDLSSQENTIPGGTKIEKYEKYLGTSTEASSTTMVDNTTVSISEDIDLPNTQVALGSSNIVKYRIYCILPDSINVQKDEEFSVVPSIIVKQKIVNN